MIEASIAKDRDNITYGGYRVVTGTSRHACGVATERETALEVFDFGRASTLCHTLGLSRILTPTVTVPRLPHSQLIPLNLAGATRWKFFAERTLTTLCCKVLYCKSNCDTRRNDTRVPNHIPSHLSASLLHLRFFL